MNFHEILRKTIFFQKSVQIIQVLLKPDKNDWYFTWKPMYIFYHISLNSYRMRNVADKHCKENQDTFYVEYFPRKSYRLWDNLRKYKVIEKMDGIWKRYNLESTRRIYTFAS